MTTPLLCLLGFALWTVLLVSTVATWRTVQVLRGEIPSNGFKSGQEHGSERYWRLNRAHANTAENLPIFGAIVLAGAVADVQEPSLATLALVVLVARFFQTGVHVSSGSAMAVNVRFTFFVTQLICMVLMAGITARALV
ncbi:MAG: MAPEG family protein [Proteobacteria bacterium]|nr:MAPEG family protein [Pseudomonadota bacterium]